MVTDFGIAWAMEAGARLTATGMAVGTPTYMSPEQAVGERGLDGRSDIYYAGVLGYQMLTGRVPFEAANSMALLLKHVSERPRPIADLRPDAPRTLREAVERALMKAPEDRWPTAAAFREALTSNDTSGPVWRAEPREPVRYTSPRPEGSRRVPAVRTPSPRRPLSRDAEDSSVASLPRSDSGPNAAEARPPIVFEQPHLASLTPAQREDLRLWHGHVNLMDRIKATRRYAVATLGAVIGGVTGFVFGVSEAPPFVLAPIVPMFMSWKLWRRGKSLRESGLRLRRVLLMPRMRWVIPPPPAGAEQQLEKLAPREILDGPEGGVIRRAVDDRAAILQIVASLPKADRALISEVEPTVKALVDRISHIAHLLHRLDQSIDPGLAAELDGRIADVEAEGASPDGERRLGLLRRQRGTVEELVQRRAVLARQRDSAGLGLGSLRLDLIKLRSSGLQSALSDVSTATQEVRALSNEIDSLLAAAAEVRGL